MSDTPTRATFQVMTGSAEPISVHFNPESLELTIENNLAEQGEGDAAKQYISQATSKLAMTLQFDSTGTGADVRDTTRRFAQIMGGVADSGATASQSEPQRVPAIVKFDWGAFTFQGTITSYKETLDFWSSEGVPLRASLALTLQKQDRVFNDDNRNPGVTTNTTGQISLPPASGGSVADVAARGGDPRAARAIGAQNGAPSLRAGLSRGLTVGAQSAGGAALSQAFSASSAAAQATSRASAAGGVFSDLRNTATASLGSFKPERVLGSRPTIGAGTTLAPGGRVVSAGSPGLTADVGVGKALGDRIRFGEEG